MFNPEAGQREPEQETPQNEIIVEKQEEKRGYKKRSKTEADVKRLNAENEEIKKAQEELKEKFSQKSPEEKKSEYQTRESKGKIRSIERGESTRYERGQIYKAYKILRKDIQEAEKDGERAVGKRELLGEVRSKAKEVEADLDEAERQLTENIQMVDVETSEGKFSMPVAVLDLKKRETNEKGERKDDRVPYVFWGGIRANEQMDGCAMMAMALAGHKIYHITHLEQGDVKKPEGTRGIVANRGDFSLQGEITEKVIDALKLEKFNLMGYSTGASVVLEAAIRMSENRTSEKINDMVVIEPLGLEKMGILKLAYNFGIKEAMINLRREKAESDIKVMRQGGKTNKEDAKFSWLTTAPILSKKHFDADRLSKIKIGGKLQWWLGGNSPITNRKLTEQVLNNVAEKNPDINQELNIVEGATHSMLNMNALGLAQEFGKEKLVSNSASPRILNRKDLANSAVKSIIEGIGTEPK